MKSLTVFALAVTVTVANWGNTQITDTALLIGMFALYRLLGGATRHN